ncbi:MAG: phenylalanine--tRNA ligase subunit alpha [Parcubacteria group bacterium]|nr:phenylalanine--tRNA ligase subunit alpha [Parcubacteria group bacterium]
MPLRDIQEKFSRDLKGVSSLEDIERLRIAYLGRKGSLTGVLRELKNLPAKSRKKTGDAANILKRRIRRDLEKRIAKFQSMRVESLDREWIDVSAPGERQPLGHLHPLSRLLREMVEIFGGLGFTLVEGPEVETEYFNFDSLNIPPDHPARDMQDTFWLDVPFTDSRFLMRTHTTAVQLRYMREHDPPFRIISPGKVFRYESTDASHDIQFQQLDGLMLGRDVSVGHFRAIVQAFFGRLFAGKIQTRLRAGYFPFVEPGFEIDITCIACAGTGCAVCQQAGWVEIMGAGMVHPFVLKEAGYRPGDWQGFAFGMGYDRLAMLKYGIDDVRQFRSGDLRFLARR